MEGTEEEAEVENESTLCITAPQICLCHVCRALIDTIGLLIGLFTMGLFVGLITIGLFVGHFTTGLFVGHFSMGLLLT